MDSFWAVGIPPEVAREIELMEKQLQKFLEDNADAVHDHRS